MKVQRLLEKRLGRDMFILSISLDPKVDTPDVLKEYAKRFTAGPGWIFLTGKHEDIEFLRYRMGIYDPDPIVDADKTAHGGILTFGNERTGKWAALPSLLKPKHIVEAVLRIADRKVTPR